MGNDGFWGLVGGCWGLVGAEKPSPTPQIILIGAGWENHLGWFRRISGAPDEEGGPVRD